MPRTKKKAKRKVSDKAILGIIKNKKKFNPGMVKWAKAEAKKRKLK